MSKGLYEIACGNEQAPAEDEEKLEKWKLKDAKALKVLVMRMEENVVSHVMHNEQFYCDGFFTLIGETPQRGGSFYFSGGIGRAITK